MHRSDGPEAVREAGWCPSIFGAIGGSQKKLKKRGDVPHLEASGVAKVERMVKIAVGPKKLKDERVVSALDSSDTLKHIPVAAIDFVFVEPTLRDAARKWIESRRSSLLALPRTEEN